MKLSTYITIIIVSLCLSGCNQPPSVNELCEIHTEFCEKFTPDSWCKAERKYMLYAHNDLATSQADDDKYKLLIRLEKYKACMNHAGKIEHIKLKEKKTARLKNEAMAIDEINKLSKETQNSNNPYLLYFHWSRYLNEAALNKFVAKEGTDELESSELQFFLATYYTKINDKKTLGLLYKALELYQPEQEINTEIFKSLITIFTDQKEYKQAYIWLKVLSLYNPNEKELKHNSLEEFAQFYRLDGKFLDKVAESTLDKITDGQFKSPKF